jgi:diguanylate cyclase (GGDEF)-like protein/PAS domain S-box-containing protein
MKSQSSQIKELTLQREQNKLMLDIIDAIPDPIVAKTWEGNFIFSNKACAKLYNTSPELMIGRDDAYFTGNQVQNDFFRENIQSIMSKFKPDIAYEQSTDAKTGKIRHFHSHKIPFKDIDNNLNIAVIASDITEITDLKNQAEFNEKRLNYVLAATQEGFWDWNIETGEIFHNKFWNELAGIEESDFSFAEFKSLIHPDDQQEVQRTLQIALNDFLPFQVTFRFVRQDGTTIWVKDRGQVVEKNDSNEPKRMVGSVHEVTHEVNQHEQIQQLAFYDPLTSLANRRLLDELLIEKIDEHLAEGNCGALLFLDLDHFKILNDTHGHHMGDTLLLAVAKRLKGQLREEDLVARFGGDEFVIILNNLSQDHSIATERAQKIAEKIKQSISQPFSLSNDGLCISFEYEVATSIGIVIFPTYSENVDQLLQLADLALYKAKDNGRDNIVVFEAYMQEELQQQTLLQSKLKEAIYAGKLSLYYQGKYNSTLNLVGAEALVRWIDDDGKMIFPDEFIPLAEESNLVIPMGLNLLEQACNQLTEWSKHPSLKKLSLAVNVSAKQVWHQDFLESFTAVIKEKCINPTLLTLEITESLMVNDIKDTINKLIALKKLGVKFSLDDFGTGYSSLSYLKELPVDEIKIDASFVRDIVEDESDLMMVKAILDLGLNFKVGVVAEGVETSEQMAKLQSMNMLSYQGYLLSKPLPIEAFEALAKAK